MHIILLLFKFAAVNLNQIIAFMKKFALSIIAVCLSLNALATDKLRVGYCLGEVTKTGTEVAKDSRWVDAAIYLDAAQLQGLGGNELQQISVGVANRVNVDSIRVWVRSSLSGGNLAEGLITTRTEQKIVRGWNDINLQSPYVLEEGKGLYIGYSYHQRSTAKPVSVVGKPTKNAFFLNANNGAGWKDRSSEGVLSIEGVVVGDGLMQHDMGIVSAIAKANSGTGNVDISVDLYNYGTKAVSGLTLKAYVTGTDEVYEHHHRQAIGSNESSTVSFSISPVADGIGIDHSIEVEIAAIDGDVTDQNAANDRAAAAFSYVRKVLVEEFTTEECPNCPRVAEYLHNVLAKPKYSGIAHAVAHHSAYRTDWLTTDADLQYTKLFNDRITYAPALMYDRMPYFETDAGKPTPVALPLSASSIEAVLDLRLKDDAFANLSIEQEVVSGDEQTVNVTVIGRRSKEIGSTPNRVTVYLVEDGIKEMSQAGYDGVVFFHNNVMRAYNSTWGDLVTWSNNKFEYSCSFTIDKSWNTENMRIVAFINNYDSSDYTKYSIENSEFVTFGKTTALKGVKTENARPVEYYTIGGVRLSKPGSGLHIVKYSDGSTRKVIFK